MNTHTVEQAKIEKQRIENEISELLGAYLKEYGVTVKYINIQEPSYIYTYNNFVLSEYGISLDIDF